jgi:hypothetical protein
LGRHSGNEKIEGDLNRAAQHIIGALLCLLSVAACDSGVSPRRAPGFSESAIGKVHAGMSEAEVRQQLGSPLFRAPRQGGASVLLAYATSGAEGMSYRVGLDSRVFLDGGKVVRADVFNVATNTACECKAANCDERWPARCFLDHEPRR